MSTLRLCNARLIDGTGRSPEASMSPAMLDAGITFVEDIRVLHGPEWVWLVLREGRVVAGSAA